MIDSLPLSPAVDQRDPLTIKKQGESSGFYFCNCDIVPKISVISGLSKQSTYSYKSVWALSSLYDLGCQEVPPITKLQNRDLRNLTEQSQEEEVLRINHSEVGPIGATIEDDQFVGYPTCSFKDI